MGEREISNLKNASRLTDKLRGLQSNRGCLEVSMTALGSNITPDEALTGIAINQKGNRKGIGYLEKHGLKLIATSEIDSETNPEEIEQLIDNKRLFALFGTTRPNNLVKGSILAFSPKETDEYGHAIAIIHRDNLSRNDRRELKREGSHLIVDTERPGLFASIDADTLARDLNDLLHKGYKTVFYFVTKKRS